MRGRQKAQRRTPFSLLRHSFSSYLSFSAHFTPRAAGWEGRRQERKNGENICLPDPTGGGRRHSLPTPPPSSSLLRILPLHTMAAPWEENFPSLWVLWKGGSHATLGKGALQGEPHCTCISLPISCLSHLPCMPHFFFLPFLLP